MAPKWASSLLVVPFFAAILFLVLYINLTPRIQIQNLSSEIPDSPPQKNKHEDDSEFKYEKVETPYSPRKPVEHAVEHPETLGIKDKRTMSEKTKHIQQAREMAEQGTILNFETFFNNQIGPTDILYLGNVMGQYSENNLQVLKACLASHDMYFDFRHKHINIELFDIERMKDYCSAPVAKDARIWDMNAHYAQKFPLSYDRLVNFVQSSYVYPDVKAERYVSDWFQNRRKFPDRPHVCLRLDKDNKPEVCEERMKEWAKKVNVDPTEYLGMCNPTPEWLEKLVEKHFGITEEFELSMDRIWRIQHPFVEHFKERFNELPDRFRTFQKYRSWFFANCQYLIYFPYHTFDFIIRNWHQKYSKDGMQFPSQDLPHILKFVQNNKKWRPRPYSKPIEKYVPVSTFPPLTAVNNFTHFTHDSNQVTNKVIRLEGFFGRLFNRMTILTKVCFKAHQLGYHLFLAHDIKDKIDNFLMEKENILSFCHFKISDDAEYYSLNGKDGFFVDVNPLEYNDFLGSDFIKFPIETRKWVEEFYTEHKTDRIVVGLHHRGLEGACEWRTEEWGERYGFTDDEIYDYRRVCEMTLEDLNYILREKLNIHGEYDFVLATDGQFKEGDATFKKLGDRLWRTPRKWGVVGDAYLLTFVDVLIWNVDSTIDLFVHQMHQRKHPNAIQYPPAELLHNQLFRGWKPWKINKIKKPNTTELEERFFVNPETAHKFD